MNKLEKVKFMFHKKENSSLDLESFGQFRMGLTKEEIKDYLRARANTLNVERLYKKFCDIAGCNTMSSFHCPKCKYNTSLLYRHDALRFADVLFGKTKETYWD